MYYVFYDELLLNYFELLFYWKNMCDFENLLFDYLVLLVYMFSLLVMLGEKGEC